MFFSNSIANKKGFLPRPAPFRGWTGGERGVGSAQSDAIRNIYGALAFFPGNGGGVPFSDLGGCIFATGEGSAIETWLGGKTFLPSYRLSIDAARVVPTAAENRPANVAVPVILYLGLSA